MMIVDASVWVRALVDASPAGDAARQALTSDPDWVVPVHMPDEALRGLRRYEAAGVLTTSQADVFAEEVGQAPVPCMRTTRSAPGTAEGHNQLRFFGYSRPLPRQNAMNSETITGSDLRQQRLTSAWRCQHSYR